MRGVRDELAHLLLAAMALAERGLDVVEHRVEGGADLPDLGALVGEAARHPLGHLDLARGERELGDAVRGGRDLAERRELAAYDDKADEAGARDATEREDRRHGGELAHGVVHVGRRQTDDPAGVAGADRRDAERAVAGDLQGACVRVGGEDLLDLRLRQRLVTLEALAQDRTAPAAGPVEADDEGTGAEVAVVRPGAAAGTAGHRLRRRGDPLVELVREVGLHHQHGGARDQDRHEGDQCDGDCHQPRRQRPEAVHGAGFRT